MTDENKKSLLKNALFILLGLILGFLLKCSVIDFSKVSGSSMEPTINPGSTVIINKLAYGVCFPLQDELSLSWKKPKLNDVVIFFYNNKPLIKRIVGLEGDTIEFLSNSSYSLIVNGVQIPLTEAQYQRIKYDTVVPKGTALCIGDNYIESVDSRNFGFIPINRILGKIICK